MSAPAGRKQLWWCDGTVLHDRGYNEGKSFDSTLGSSSHGQSRTELPSSEPGPCQLTPRPWRPVLAIA